MTISSFKVTFDTHGKLCYSVSSLLLLDDFLVFHVPRKGSTESESHTLAWINYTLTLSKPLRESSSPSILLQLFHLTHRLADLFCKGSDSKSLRFYGPHRLCHNYLPIQQQHKHSHGPHTGCQDNMTDGHALEFHRICRCHEILPFFQFFLQPLQNVKASLSSQAEQKWVGILWMP